MKSNNKIKKEDFKEEIKEESEAGDESRTTIIYDNLVKSFLSKCFPCLDKGHHKKIDFLTRD